MNRREFMTTAACAASGAALAPDGVRAVERAADAGSIRGFHPDMRYRTFGRTGEKVSVLGFGCMRLPVKDGDYGRVDEPAALRLVRFAADHGLNYLDTSWPYHSMTTEGGTSEPFVGRAAQEIGRDRVFIATKLPIWLVRTRADMDRYLDMQLKRLRTDHIDFYLVHNIRQPWWDAMKRLGLRDFLDRIQESGKARHVGFSFHDMPSVHRDVMDYYDWSFSQHVCNWHDVSYNAGMAGIRHVALRDMGLVAMEPIMGGMLAGRLPKEAADILGSSGVRRSPAAWALRWVWNNPEVKVAISGMNAMEHVRENLETAKDADIPLTPAELAAIDRARAFLKGRSDVPCTECGVCSCAKGVDIRLCLSIYATHHAFKVVTISNHNYGLMVKDGLRAAENCDGCGRCACPCGVDIPAAMRKVSAFFKDAKTGW